MRKRRIIFDKPGGNASKNAVSYKISLPSGWIKEMGISQDDRYVSIEFDGEKITIKKIQSDE